MLLNSENWNDYDQYAKYYDEDYSYDEKDTYLIKKVAGIYGGPVLDIGCGSGRTMFPLLDEGYEVTGFDISEEMLQICQEKIALRDDSTKAKLIQADMTDFKIDEKFGTAFCIISLQHLTSREAVLSCMKKAHEHLKSGAIFMIVATNYFRNYTDMIGDETPRYHICPIGVNDDGMNVFNFFEHRYFSDNHSFGFSQHRGETSEDLEKMVAERDGKEIFEECRYMFSTRSLILYPEDYEKLFNEAGFDVLKAGGDATLRPFDKDEDTGMYMIARRR